MSRGYWGFRKTFRLGAGLRMTMGKKSVGLSAGGRWARWGINSLQGTRARFTLPGSGLYYEQRSGGFGGRQQHHTDLKRPQRLPRTPVEQSNEDARSRTALYLRLALFIGSVVARSLTKR